MPEEVELKLVLAPEAVAQFRRHPLLRSLQQGKTTQRRLVNTYFDTPTQRLRKNHIALRIRRTGRQRIQTIKRDALPGQSGWVRGEWEMPLAADVPDLTQLDDAALRSVLLPRRGRLALQPVFVTDFRRTTWLLKTAHAEVECSLDFGEVRAGEATVPICEVELEWKSGDRKELFALARQLNQDVPLRLELASKAARGYALAAGQKPVPVFSQQVPVDAAMTVQSAFAAIAHSCLAHILANFAGAQAGGEAEYVHQLRVGIRRLRGALLSFREVIPRAERQHLGTELRWLLQEVGPAREWDVLLANTLQPVRKRFAHREGLRRIQALAEAQRMAGYARAEKSLRSARATGLLLQLAAWLDAWTRQQPAAQDEQSRLPQPVAELAVEILERRHRKVRKLGRRIRKLSAEELHQLRIEIKKLRYATEFFHALWPRRASGRYIAALKDLQDVLGTMNDAAIAEQQGHKLELEAGAGVEHDCGLLLGWISAHLRHDRRHLRVVWQRFARLGPFW
jgi:inorganic triphosphatase YgiF